MTTIVDGSTAERIGLARQLFEEYASWVEISLCFQGFDKELATLPGAYTPPKGCLFLAYVDDRLAGCGALRPLEADCCEMKRLYVRPDFRGLGVGKRLMEAIISSGREIGYKSMKLDTLPAKMDQALAMYRRYGFKEIEPYYPNPVEGGAIYMELVL